MAGTGSHRPNERVDKPHEVVIIGGGFGGPGFYALRYPPMTAMGFLMLHLVFGAIVGALYGAWAG